MGGQMRGKKRFVQCFNKTTFIKTLKRINGTNREEEDFLVTRNT